MDTLITFGPRAKARVKIFDNLEDCAWMTVNYLTKGCIALSGGSTFAGLFPLWVRLSPDVEDSTFFPVDERKTPFDSSESNWGTAYRKFLRHVGREADRENHPGSVDAYREIIRLHFGKHFPVFDAILLGVGGDGHTASLFPRGAYLDDKESIVLATKSPKPPVNRITLAPKVLSKAEELVVIVAGEGKRRMWEKVLKQDDSLPIVKILSERADSLVLVEKSVAP